MFIMDEIRENTAGAIMTPEFVRLRAGTRTGEAIRAVRASGLDSDALYTLFITDGDGRLLGTLEMRTLLAAPGDEPVEALMDTAFTAVAMDADQQEAARLVRKYDLISLPVTDREGRLVGAIGVNSIVDVIEEEDTEDFERMAALVPSEDGYAASSVWALAWHRLPWLLILMASAVLCAKLIQHYEELLLLSALGGVVMSNIPMLMDTGGNAGSQSSTLIIRAMALGDMTARDDALTLGKELLTSLLCGAGLGVVNFARMMLISRDTMLEAGVISLAVCLTVIAANAIGCLLPMLARRLRLDPALMAGPLLTTIVDILGLIIVFALVTALV